MPPSHLPYFCFSSTCHIHYTRKFTQPSSCQKKTQPNPPQPRPHHPANNTPAYPSHSTLHQHKKPHRTLPSDSPPLPHATSSPFLQPRPTTPTLHRTITGLNEFHVGAIVSAGVGGAGGGS
eukprot:GFKZ01012279.1.p1 GENE.GFKZ01012279.1~~GFKZ01012279.1.p1  ORF type:complete len:121 (-),score=3.87 GFKZ01012279.1:380-742(-)